MLGWEIAAAPQLITPEEAVALDDEMRAFVAPYRAIGDPAMKLRRLLEGMRDRGLFAMSYSDSFTRSASRTFHERQGNCLSFTMLFVALARAAGLDARYQAVDVPPTWTNDNELLVIANHVNTAVNQGYSRATTAGSSEPFPRAPFDRKVIVDFNAAELPRQLSRAAWSRIATWSRSSTTTSRPRRSSASNTRRASSCCARLRAPMRTCPVRG